MFPENEALQLRGIHFVGLKSAEEIITETKAVMNSRI
jgi:hypothetical protein